MNAPKRARGLLKRIRRRIMRELGVPTEEKKRNPIRGLKDIHKGRRVFIVGNGPSMRPEYFDLLEGEISFGFNQVYKLFPKHRWRPTYLMVQDPVLGETLGTKVLADPAVRVIAWDALHKFIGDHPAVTYYRLGYPSHDGVKPTFRTDPATGLQASSTVVYAALQIAWYMGVREIYLLGVDLRYNIKEEAFIRPHYRYRVIQGDFKGSYFDPSLEPGQEERIAPDLDGMVLAMESAAEFFRDNGGRIFNAAPGSPLKLFPAKPIHEVVGESPATADNGTTEQER